MDNKKNTGPDYEGIARQWELLDSNSLFSTEENVEWSAYERTCKMLDEMKEIDKYDTEHAWNKLFNRLDNESLIPEQTKPLIRFNWQRMAVAASIAVLLGLTFTWMYVKQNNGSNSLNTLVAANIQQVVLTDGSIVNLNKGASLTYPDLFNDSVRKVTLKGEAYFQIAKNPNCPFIIETDMAMIRVLGTSFNVDMQNNQLLVTVSSGKVQLATINPTLDTIVLIPGETGFTDGLRIEKNTNKNTNYLSWYNKKLVFKASPLNKVITDIEKTYQVEIESDIPNIDTFLLSATFDQAKLEEVITAVSLTFNLHAEYKNEKCIIFQPNVSN